MVKLKNLFKSEEKIMADIIVNSSIKQLKSFIIGLEATIKVKELLDEPFIEVVKKEVLKEAPKKPEKHKDLIG